ncbi:acyl-CoA dehydrogenase family protein [Ralstonia solanacearum]|uniref:Acyl-CoA dehydrogenase n=1 Tax=Ralstonia solanacearum K60 TaxID=1091042 RepID=A0AAP7ZPU5_RALSL|nr:acyl-CoA dehydrogenase [Ralstonia solanacearum]MBT1538550.1 acyl-CoA dehydrogenase family protein [Ralstonia solanacearum]OYQ14560.1 acyl-CoA dehydrogenase [Ralstonia solanacearum K60]QOK81935.1 acyl-CoA dehydrogenase [Ralstonia solanacearum]RIJ85658.1 acyl-CoA dehydrogenase [Ralstonia solanacearum]CCF99027.1 putative acyl-CoA dehydrogenase [Ralstonia solanacearum K60]
MDFSFTDEQKQLADAVRRFIDKDYGFEARNKVVYSAEGVSQAHWDALAELGLTALPVPEAQGGFDGRATDLLVVMQELGRGLVVEPYAATVLGTQALKLAGGQAALLEQVAGGALKLAVAFGEPQSRYELFNVTTRATQQGGGWTLSGAKAVAVHGAQADKLVVSARTGRMDDGARDTSGLSLFLVDRDAAGVTVKDYRTIDNLRAADIRFDHAPATLLGQAGEAWAILDAVADFGCVLLCAEAVGLIDALNAATLEYTKTRQQFGVPIARFQALQHRMVDMFIHAEQARSITYLAAAHFEDGDAEARRRYVSAAKARVGQAAREVGQEAVQLHGGMGVTNELPAAHMFKRLTMINTTLGDVDHHLARFASLPGFRNAA